MSFFSRLLAVWTGSAGRVDRLETVIEAVARAQKKTVVVAAVPGQILTDWREEVAAILIPFLPGEQYGNAIADIILGLVTPQAKLPLSFPNKDNEQGMTEAQWPGLPSKEFPGHNDAHYTEGQIVGYRFYDKHNIKPAFAFGHGLSYGTAKYLLRARNVFHLNPSFYLCLWVCVMTHCCICRSRYSGLKVDKVSFPGASTWIVTFQVATTAGSCDTPQLYIGYPGAATDPKRPMKVLRGFKKTCHAVSPLAEVKFTLTARDVVSPHARGRRL